MGKADSVVVHNPPTSNNSQSHIKPKSIRTTTRPRFFCIKTKSAKPRITKEEIQNFYRRR